MKVSSIMNTDIIAVSESATIREVFFLMQKHPLGAFPVVNVDNEFVGIVSEENMLKTIYPDAAELKDLEPDPETLKEKIVQSHSMRVGEVMEKNAFTTYPNTSTIKVGIKMILDNLRLVPVLENKKIVGIVTDTLIFLEIMKAGLSDETGKVTGASPVEPKPAPPKPSEDPFSGAEKRLHLRMSLKVPIRYRVLDPKNPIPSGIENTADSVDVSAGGLSLKTPAKLKAGDLLNIKFQISSLHAPIECMVRVCRSFYSSGNNFKAGVMFLALSTKERSDIDKFIRQNISHP